MVPLHFWVCFLKSSRKIWAPSIFWRDNFKIRTPIPAYCCKEDHCGEASWSFIFLKPLAISVLLHTGVHMSPNLTSKYGCKIGTGIHSLTSRKTNAGNKHNTSCQGRFEGLNEIHKGHALSQYAWIETAFSSDMNIPVSKIFEISSTSWTIAQIWRRKSDDKFALPWTLVVTTCIRTVTY